MLGRTAQPVDQRLRGRTAKTLLQFPHGCILLHRSK